MIFGGAEGELWRAFEPRRWELHRWIWWLLATRAPWFWRAIGRRMPHTGLVTILGRPIRVVEETRVKLPHLPTPRHHGASETKRAKSTQAKGRS